MAGENDQEKIKKALREILFNQKKWYHTYWFKFCLAFLTVAACYSTNLVIEDRVKHVCYGVESQQKQLSVQFLGYEDLTYAELRFRNCVTHERNRAYELIASCLVFPVIAIIAGFVFVLDYVLNNFWTVFFGMTTLGLLSGFWSIFGRRIRNILYAGEVPIQVGADRYQTYEVTGYSEECLTDGSSFMYPYGKGPESIENYHKSKPMNSEVQFAIQDVVDARLDEKVETSVGGSLPLMIIGSGFVTKMFEGRAYVLAPYHVIHKAEFIVKYIDGKWEVKRLDPLMIVTDESPTHVDAATYPYPWERKTFIYPKISMNIDYNIMSATMTSTEHVSTPEGGFTRIVHSTGTVQNVRPPDREENLLLDLEKLSTRPGMSGTPIYSSSGELLTMHVWSNISRKVNVGINVGFLLNSIKKEYGFDGPPPKRYDLFNKYFNAYPEKKFVRALKYKAEGKTFRRGSTSTKSKMQGRNDKQKRRRVNKPKKNYESGYSGAFNLVDMEDARVQELMRSYAATRGESFSSFCSQNLDISTLFNIIKTATTDQQESLLTQALNALDIGGDAEFNEQIYDLHMKGTGLIDFAQVHMREIIEMYEDYEDFNGFSNEIDYDGDDDDDYDYECLEVQSEAKANEMEPSRKYQDDIIIQLTSDEEDLKRIGENMRINPFESTQPQLTAEELKAFEHIDEDGRQFRYPSYNSNKEHQDLVVISEAAHRKKYPDRIYGDSPVDRAAKSALAHSVGVIYQDYATYTPLTMEVLTDVEYLHKLYLKKLKQGASVGVAKYTTKQKTTVDLLQYVCGNMDNKGDASLNWEANVRTFAERMSKYIVWINEGGHYKASYSVFLKLEPHNSKKVAEGRWRQIHAPDFIDKALQIALLSHLQAFENASWPRSNFKASMPYGAAILTNKLTGEVADDESMISTDLSGFDNHRHDALRKAARDVFMMLIDDSMKTFAGAIYDSAFIGESMAPFGLMILRRLNSYVTGNYGTLNENTRNRKQVGIACRWLCDLLISMGFKRSQLHDVDGRELEFGELTKVFNDFLSSRSWCHDNSERLLPLQDSRIFIKGDDMMEPWLSEYIWMYKPVMEVILGMTVKHVQVGTAFPKAPSLLPVRGLEFAGFIMENTAEIKGIGQQIQFAYGSPNKLYFEIACGNHDDIADATGSRMGNVITNPRRVGPIWETTLTAMELRNTKFTDEDVQSIHRALLSNIMAHTRVCDYVNEARAVCAMAQDTTLEDLVDHSSSHYLIRSLNTSADTRPLLKKILNYEDYYYIDENDDTVTVRRKEDDCRIGRFKRHCYTGGEGWMLRPDDFDYIDEDAFLSREFSQHVRDVIDDAVSMKNVSFVFDDSKDEPKNLTKDAKQEEEREDAKGDGGDKPTKAQSKKWKAKKKKEQIERDLKQLS